MQPSEQSKAPKAVVEDSGFEEQVLAAAEKGAAEVSIHWSKVFIVSDWSTIREPKEKEIVSQNRIVEIVGVVTEDDDHEGVRFRSGDCYVYRTNAYQEISATESAAVSKVPPTPPLHQPGPDRDEDQAVEPILPPEQAERTEPVIEKEGDEPKDKRDGRQRCEVPKVVDACANYIPQ